MGEMKVTLCGIEMDNPIIPASGTFGFGYEFAELYDINCLGTFSFKGTTKDPRFGNPTPRIAETPNGMINAVGLQNPGVEKVISEELPKLFKVFDKKVMANVSGFSVEDYAYTVDGGALGELEYENFNAAAARITIKGRNVHPGYAKDKMINAIQVACELNALLPTVQRPEYTTDYEGFFHCVGFNGTVENAKLSYIIRDHDSEKFEQKKVLMWSCVDMLQKRYGENVLKLVLKDQYFNMRKMVEPHPQVIDKAMEEEKAYAEY